MEMQVQQSRIIGLRNRMITYINSPIPDLTPERNGIEEQYKLAKERASRYNSLVAEYDKLKARSIGEDCLAEQIGIVEEMVPELDGRMLDMLKVSKGHIATFVKQTEHELQALNSRRFVLGRGTRSKILRSMADAGEGYKGKIDRIVQRYTSKQVEIVP